METLARRSARRHLTLASGGIAVLAMVWLGAGSARAQEVPLGHRVLGTLGLGAGRAPSIGLYVQEQFVAYRSGTLVDRDGDVVAVDLQLNALAAVTGISGTFTIPDLRARGSLAVGLPVGRVQLRGGELLLQKTSSGIGDVYIKPLGLGWSLSRVDLVIAYGFYVPTGRFTPGAPGNMSQAQWTQEWSAGGNVAFDARRRWQLSALASYALNHPKLGIDITRGSTVQVQGGFGYTIARIVEVGAVGAALFQVTEDSGGALPPQLQGAREQAVAVGAEAAVDTKKLRMRWVLRYEHDVLARARTLGHVFFASVVVKAL